MTCNGEDSLILDEAGVGVLHVTGFGGEPNADRRGRCLSPLGPLGWIEIEI